MVCEEVIIRLSATNALPGLDTNLSIVPVEAYGEEYHRVISGLPQQPQVTSSPSTRTVVSWESHTISVWNIKSAEEMTSRKRVHRLLARLEIKGDESIADCAVSLDGRFIAIATSAQTKIFQVKVTEDYSAAKVKQIKLAKALPGGSAVQFSPDQKWLSIITPANEPLLFQVTSDENTIAFPRKAITLKRSKRAATDTSSLQAYRRAITQQLFSDDSKVLVVSDLLGFIDAWRLQGEGDAAAPDIEMKDEDDEVSEISSDDDEDDEAETAPQGARWKAMESAKLLPQLDSHALVLSFRPGKAFEPALTNGVNGTSGGDHVPIKTEQNENYELFVLTANHHLHEFDLSIGKLTDWSRRNPTEHLPEAFRKIKDRAMGCYWHTRTDAQRLYLHGSNWIFMFDVGQDLDVPVPTEGDMQGGLIERPKKRKWEGESGAGDKKRKEDCTGFRPGVTVTGEFSQKHVKTEQASQNLLKSGEAKDEDDDDEEEDEEDVHEGKSLRVRKEVGEDEVNEDAQEDGQPRKSWHSFAYRPILAIVPLQQTAEYIEKVIVERPSWELNLPPRMLGPHEKA